MKLFVGKEAEGPFKGVMTLFVGVRNIQPSKIISALQRLPEVKAVYFGANNVRGISEQCFLLAEKLVADGLKVTIEVDDDCLYELEEKETKGMYIVFAINLCSKKWGKITGVKVVDEKCLVWLDIRTRSLTHTYLHDPLYGLDKEVY